MRKIQGWWIAAVWASVSATWAADSGQRAFQGMYELENANTGSCYTYLDVTPLPRDSGLQLQFWEADPNLQVAPRPLRLGKRTQWLDAQDAQIVSEGRWNPEVRKLVYYDAFMENCARYPFIGTKCKGDRIIHETQVKLSASGTLLTYNFQERLFLDPLIDVECEYRKR